MRQKIKTNFRLTVEFNEVDEVYKPIKRFNLHERINFRQQLVEKKKFGHILSYTEIDKIKTREQRLENYETRCIENMTKPFHYSETEWNQVLRDIEDEEHTERCAAKHAWMYEF